MSEFKLTLHKPSRQQIYVLTDIMEPKYTEVYGGINTLTFNIPTYTIDTITHNKINNPALIHLQPFYLVKHESEWFVIDKIDKNDNMQETRVEIKTSSLGSELKRKHVVNFKTGIIERPVGNLSQTMGYLLANTQWTLGTVDAGLNLKFRAIEISEKTLLDAILTEICVKWDCVVSFNTAERKLNFVKYATDGVFNGLLISDRKYMKDLKFEMEDNSICTKLIVLGKDNISINNVSPTGVNYITDYSYFKQSGYMSTGLITGLNNYDVAVNNLSTQFSTYLTELQALQTQLLGFEHQLDVLKTTPITGYNAVSTAIEIGLSQGEDVSSLRTQLASLQTQVNSLQSSISTKKTQINEKYVQIYALQDTLALSNYLTVAQAQELNNYTFEKVYKDTAISAKGNSAEVMLELLNEAKDQLSLQNQPRYSASIDIVDLLQALNVDEAEKNKLKLGTIIIVRHEEFNLDLRCKIVEIQKSFFDNKIQIKIANDKEIKSGFIKIKDLIKNSSNTSNFIQLNLDAWNKGKDANNAITEFLNNAIDMTKQTIVGGSNNTTQIDSRGITIVDPVEPQYVLRLNAGAIGLSSDAGETYNVGMSKGVIHADVLAGKIITGNMLTIGDSDGIWNQVGARVTVKNRSGTEVMKLGNFLADDGVSDRFGIKSISPTVQVGMDSIDGFWIKSKISGLWKDVMKSDPSTGDFTYIGKVDVDGSVNITGTLKVNGNDVLTSGKIKAAFIETLEVGKNVIMGSGATISWGQVTNQPYIPPPVTIPSYITSTKITEIDIESPKITGGTITGGTLNTADATKKRITISTSGITSYDGAVASGFFAVAGSSNVGSFGLKHNNANVMQMYWNGIGDGSLHSTGNLQISNGGGGNTTYMKGNVVFEGTVTGLPPAKFG